MRIFHCDHCQQPVFFENVQCLSCSHPLAYLPDVADLGSLEAVGEGVWEARAPRAVGKRYRLCQNYDRENVCNWAVEADDKRTLCVSCNLTQVIPDLTQPGTKEAWYRLEVAKRRLVYSLMKARLPLRNKSEDLQNGLAFAFLSSPIDSKGPRVLTGHSDGLITINVAEADDNEREKRRLAMHEPYRTLLGHFRHESGHYYWDRLIRDCQRLDAFRQIFGDERDDYPRALNCHYENGAPNDWNDRFVSAYASSHPWEDWAESWAHYLHMTDTLETAAACGMALRPARLTEPSLTRDQLTEPASFERMSENWFALTYVLNNLNRGLGLADAYPFALAPTVLAKLSFIHDEVKAAGRRAASNVA